MGRNTRNAIANAKLKLQDVIEKILRNHRIDPGVHKYDLRLRMPTYFDPLTGRTNNQESSEQNGDLILFVKKKAGRFIRIGQYYEQNGDHTSDPAVAFDCICRNWIPIMIERTAGDTVCSHIEKRRRIMYPDKIEEFISFQRMFAQKIRQQGWLENGIRIKRK